MTSKRKTGSSLATRHSSLLFRSSLARARFFATRISLTSNPFPDYLLYWPGDFYNELKAAHDELTGVNARLDDVKGKLDAVVAELDNVESAVNAVRDELVNVNQTLQWGFAQLITLGQYTNLALAQNDKQNDTVICLLQQISNNTCRILNEAHLQTGLQTEIEGSSKELADLYAATHAEAALTREREEALRKQVEECCPPKPPEPACQQQPCPAPDPFQQQPPQVDTQPPGGSQRIN